MQFTVVGRAAAFGQQQNHLLRDAREHAFFEQDKPYPGEALHQKTANRCGIVDGE